MDFVTRYGKERQLKNSKVFRGPAVTDMPSKELSSEIRIDTGKYREESFVELKFCT